MATTYFRLGYHDARQDQVCSRLFRTRAEAETRANYYPGSPTPPFVEEVDIGADLVFSYENAPFRNWSLWTDGAMRQAVCEPCERSYVSYESGGSRTVTYASIRAVDVPGSPVTDGAVKFINACLGGEGSAPPPWLGLLVDAREVRDVITGADRPGGFARKKAAEYALRFQDGTGKTVYVFSVGYSEGYVFDVFETLAGAKREFSPRPVTGPTECFECGATYPEPGHVEQGGMGCDRCS
jgi:hypothetical protein